MPNLRDHQSFSISKLLYEGDSNTGKTTSLSTLVEDGFKLRIWDFDDGLAGLIKDINRRCPDKLGNVEYETLKDNYTATDSGPMLDGIPNAFTRAAKLMDKWIDGSRPQDWGSEYIAVWDSLTHASRAAWNWAKLMTGNVSHIDGVASKGFDPRNIFFTAQQAIINQIAAMTSPSFNTNLILISHIRYSERQDGITKGYPLSVGTAIGPEILTYFNNHVISLETRLEGGETKRTIRTQSTFMLDLKTAADVPSVIDATSGLSRFFRRPNAKL